jgi:hypothetical protein
MTPGNENLWHTIIDQMVVKLRGFYPNKYEVYGIMTTRIA